jgi:hypothetical protein
MEREVYESIEASGASVIFFYHITSVGMRRQNTFFLRGKHVPKDMKRIKVHRMPRATLIHNKSQQQTVTVSLTCLTDLPRSLQLERGTLAHRFLGRHVENQQPHLLRRLHNRR